MVDGKMGFLFFLAVVALGAIAWLLFRIDTKLQAIGNMIHNANSPEEPWRLTVCLVIIVFGEVFSAKISYRCFDGVASDLMAPRAYRLKASNAYLTFSTAAGTSPAFLQSLYRGRLIPDRPAVGFQGG